MGMRIRMVGLLTHVSQWEALLGSAKGSHFETQCLNGTWGYPLSLGKEPQSEWWQMAAPQKSFSNFPGCVWKIQLWKLNNVNTICFPGIFLVSSKDKPKNRRGREEWGSGQVRNALTAHPDIPYFDLFRLHSNCVASVAAMRSPHHHYQGMRGKEGKKNGVGESWLCLECNVRHQHGELFIIPQLWNALISLLHLWHSLPLRAGENMRLFW